VLEEARRQGANEKRIGMETLTFQCGHCNRLMAVEMAYLGKQVRCPHCQQVVFAPQQPSPTSAMPEAAKDQDPLAVKPPADSPFAVAADAPWWASAIDVATAPPSPPEPPLPSSDDPMSHLNEPAMEPAPAPPAPRPPFEAFEAAVDDSTPSVTSNATVGEPAGLATESQSTETPSVLPTNLALSTQDVASPWGPEGAEAGIDTAGIGTLIVPRARRSQWGMTLFISLVFLPLVLYAVLATILAVMFYQQRGTGGSQEDPRQFLPDVEGDHPGFKRPNKQSLVIPDHYYTDPLQGSQRVALGHTLTIGDLEIQPVRVEWNKVRVRVGQLEPVELLNPSLVLHVKLRNLSRDISFYPLDTYFNRQWSKGEGPKPLTAVEAGGARFYGGPATWGGANHEAVEGSNCDKALLPGDSDEYFICTNGNDNDTRHLETYVGPLLWRVQVRRGLVHYRDKDLSATAVIGVEFTDKDIARP
jgi:hypothetical protein